MADSADILFYILGSEDFQEFYEEFIVPQEQENKVEFLDNYLEKIRIPECNVAVLGIQGAGKSSLLNSLIFQDEVFPVDVEETTCIPTMIRRVYKHEQEGAEIHYHDERVEEIPLNRKFLSKVVDNRYNPGNLMGADYVLCKIDSPFLKEGFVFVDLPGVGSLTEKNEKTTLEFLKQTNVGIFVLRTVPPITHSEAGFIRVAWPMIQHSIFVQNLWMQETKEEISAGMQHNLKVLEEIAKEKSAQMPKYILPVNIMMAYNGVCQENRELVQKSGLSELKIQLRNQMKGNFISTLHHNTATFFTRLIESGRSRIKQRLALLNQDQSEIVKKFEAEKQKYWQNKEELEERVSQHCQKFEEEISAIKTDWIPDKLEASVQRLLERLDAMPIEDMKEEDFRQTVSENFSEIFGHAYGDLREKLAQVAEEYVENLGSTLQQMASLASLTEKIYQEDQKKDPKLAKGWSIALTGGVAPLIVSGPAGWTILGGSMFVGSIVRWVSGSTAHKRIMRGVRKAVNDGKNKIRKEMLAEVERFKDSVIANIHETVSQELSFYSQELERLEKILNQEEEKQQEEIARLEESLQHSKVYIDTLAKV